MLKAATTQVVAAFFEVNTLFKNIFWKFFSFKGRLGRWQYFKYTLIVYIVFGPPLYWSYLQLVDNTKQMLPAAVLSWCLVLIVWSSLAIQARRFHDLEKSGRWVLLNFLVMPDGGTLSTIASWALSIWLLVFKGTDGPNEYGADPLKKKEE